jgi:predicted HTH domain antitoxin
MTLQIPDDILKAADLDERGVLIELACHLFDAERLSLGQAARLAAMSRTGFEDALHDRSIPVYRYGQDEFRQDLDALERMKQREP